VTAFSSQARRFRWTPWAISSALLVGLASSCGPEPSPVTPDMLAAPKTGDAFEGAQCSAIRPPTEPDLMGWDSGSRLNLKSNQEQGVVAVRYKAEGCNVELEVLHCIGEGTYVFSPYSATESKTAKSARDLYADLPIGAARLGSKVGGGRALRTDYMLTGVYRMTSYEAFPVAKLRGAGCAEATHVVSKMYVGGFGMVAFVTESLEASASVFGAGAGVSQDRKAERIATEGNPEACERAQREGKPEPLCSVPLRVGLVPIEGRASGSCPAGSDWDGTGCVKKGRRTEVVSPAPAAAAGVRGPAMMHIPAGRFAMGSSDGNADNGEDNQMPVHQVSVASFEMDVTEITTAQYEACVRAGACPAAGTDELTRLASYIPVFCNAGKSDRQGHPINCVSWDDATAFCGWAGRRLPTEEEWEYAARGTDSRTYPWGSAPPGSQLCWNRWNSKQGTCAVGSFPAGKSPFGLQDMAGNVWEWTSSAYCPYANKNCAEAARVVRGGGWPLASFVRASVRDGSARTSREDNRGFRCAR